MEQGRLEVQMKIKQITGRNGSLDDIVRLVWHSDRRSRQAYILYAQGMTTDESRKYPNQYQEPTEMIEIKHRVVYVFQNSSSRNVFLRVGRGPMMLSLDVSVGI